MLGILSGQAVANASASRAPKRTLRRLDSMDRSQPTGDGNDLWSRALSREFWGLMTDFEDEALRLAQYRSYQELALRRAARAQDDRRESYVDIAKGWQRLAEALESQMQSSMPAPRERGDDRRADDGTN